MGGFCNPVPDLEKTRTMATGSVPSEFIERERKKLLEVLQQDLDSILDSLNSRRLISEDEYETLEDITDPLKKSRKLLILIQKKGEVSCQHFLKCLLSIFPESETIAGLRHEFLKHENIEPPQTLGVSKNSEDLFSPREKQPENSEVTVPFEKKEPLDLDTSEMIMDEKTCYRETVWCSRESDKQCRMPPAESFDSEASVIIDYLQDGQRYEEPDDSLYLGQEDYLESVVYCEDVEEEEGNDPGHFVYDGKEAYAGTSELSGEEQIYGDSETGLSLEEEEKKSLEERKKVFKDVLSRLNLDRSRKVLPDFVGQFSVGRGCEWTPETPADLAWNFLMKVQTLDVTARDSIPRQEVLRKDGEGDLSTGVENLEIRDIQTINPQDVLCASMLCADSSLQRRVMSSMYQCQFALPLLLPDAENNKSILMLEAMKDIVKGRLAQSSRGPAGDTEEALTLMKTPVISFVRLGDCSFSKSRILNTLLCPAQPTSLKTFLHQDRPGLVLPRQISEGLVEIAWCFPGSDSLMSNPCFFQEPVAVANLHGDLESFWTQFGFLMEVSSAVFFFTNCLGEKEWNLLMFLGEDAVKRCYFVLSPQARESEEAQIVQRILKLKPSQLLVWEEEEEAGEEGRNIKGLQAALQEVMSSSLRRVSVEDMASLARELGIQVDQDFENIQGIQVSPGENTAGTIEDEGQRKHSLPQNPAEVPVEEHGAGGEASQMPQNFHFMPVFMPHPKKPCFFPVRTGGHFNRVSLRARWFAGSHLGSEQKTRWFRPPLFQISRVHSQSKGFRIPYFQPQRFCSAGRFMRFPRPAQGHHMNGLFGRPPRPIYWRVPAWPAKPQMTGACNRSVPVVTQAGHLHPQGSQTDGKSQPRQAHTQGTQSTEATGKAMRTASHTVNTHSQALQPAGVIQKPVRPAFQQGFKPKTQGGPFNPAVQMGSHPMSNNKFLPRALFSQPKPPQGKPSQPKSSQPMPSQPTQPKHSQTKSARPQPSQAKCFPSKPTQSKPCQPQSSHSKPSQPRPTQPRSSQTSSSQARSSYSRAGPRRGGKH